ncbi:MAG: AraC family transcriptional regulator [Actinomycetota bacterium]
MDPLACLLDGPRARGAFVLRSSLTAPWSIRIEDQAPLTLVTVLRGTAWLRTDSGGAFALDTADVAILRGPEPYIVSDDDSRPPQVVIDAGQECRSVDPQRENPMGPQGGRSWGNSPDGETMMLTGTYRTHPELSQHLLTALPPVVVLPGPEWTNPLIGYLTQESERDEPGQDAVLDRLLDLVLIAVLRSWFSRADAAAPGWYRAHSDPVVGRALALIHDQPAELWSVGALASAIGTSRASLARRFHDLVGQTPIAYLTSWRLTLAADLLTESDATLEQVARQVGYSNAFALSTAFKRIRGISPSQHRRAASG